MSGRESSTTGPEQLGSPAARALLGYMLWLSEENYCAGWLVGLERAMLGDDPYRWLVEQAGGWWTFNDSWGPGEPEHLFISGALVDLERTRA